jgi:lipopolysaccharide transport system ATP-binding protein
MSIGSVISVEGLSKVYSLSHKVASMTIRDAIHDALSSGLNLLNGRGNSKAESEEFWALDDITFEIAPGEVVGIVGRNGAGKSTLLKVLSRIVEPTRGSVSLRGKVASLLEVGTGFHPELSGRENIFLNGSILGMRRAEIQSKFDEIVAFAEVEKFLDTQVKRYSSGMYVRLAFAVAAHLEPDVLIVDEVLAVGDAAFQRKCLGKIKGVASESGRTVLFVSHNMGAVESLCGRAVLLSGGRLVADGAPRDVVAAYLGAGANQGQNGHFPIDAGHPGRAPGVAPKLLSVNVRNVSDGTKSGFRPGERVRISIDHGFSLSVRAPRVGLGFDNARGERIFAVATYLSAQPVDDLLPGKPLCVEFDVPPVYPGSYAFDVSLSGEDGKFIDRVERAGSLEVLQTGWLGSSYPYFPEMGQVLVRSSWTN